MVAPVQGSVGKTSNDPATQDYLTELTNFYNKPENEGVKSEFVAPDGSKFEIEDASYLARVRSNVNTGKLDKGADLDLEGSEYAKNKKEGAEKVDNAMLNKADDAKSSGKQKKSEGESKIKNTDSTISKSEEKTEKSKAKVEVSKTKTEAINAETTEIFKKMDQNNKKLITISKQIMDKTNAAFAKAKTLRAQKAESQAEEMVEDSSTQSGSKMGFEGKLMTVASAPKSGGDKALDKSWEDTINGKIKISSDLLKQQTPVLLKVKEEGQKAAQPLLDQAKASVDAAANSDDQAGTLKTQANIQTASGAVTAIAGVLDVTIGLPLIPPVLTMPAGTTKTILGVTTIISGLGTIVASEMGPRKQAEAKWAEANTLCETAKKQESQASVARKQAIAAANQSNVKIIKATQSLNKTTQEMSKGLSASSYAGVNTDGMDEAQIESVKKQRYDQIMAHEQAHAAIIGGTPVIETDSNGVAIGGYVQIDIPSVDDNDLEGTIEKAQRVIDAALAPSDPSAQDQNIASQARNVLSQAQSRLEEKTKKVEEEVKAEEKGEKKEEVKEVKEEKEVKETK